MHEAPRYAFSDHRIAGWYYPWVMRGKRPTPSPLEAKMRIAKATGYDAIGTTWWDLLSFYQERGDLQRLQTLSASLGIAFSGYTFVVENWAFSDGVARSNALIMAKSAVDLARDAGCKAACIVAPFDKGDLRQAGKMLREMAQYAGQFGLRLGVEFIGIAPQVNNLKTAWEILDYADVENSGVAIDSYHFFAGRSSYADLEAFPLDKILAVHLADAPADLSDPSIDFHREMIGDGELPLSEFVKALDAKGFHGYWDLECINNDDYASDLRAVATRGFERMKHLVESSLGTPASLESKSAGEG